MRSLIKSKVWAPFFLDNRSHPRLSLSFLATSTQLMRELSEDNEEETLLLGSEMVVGSLLPSFDNQLCFHLQERESSCMVQFVCKITAIIDFK
jgi:hypothetical protein